MYNSVDRYNVLLFDDDVVFLGVLQNEILQLNNNSQFVVQVFMASTSRQAMRLADLHTFDYIVLDVGTSSFYYPDTGMERKSIFDYAGDELYDELVKNHPSLSHGTKFIILSNLYNNEVRSIFRHAHAEILHKQEHSCKNVVQYIKCNIESLRKHYVSTSKTDIQNIHINADNGSIVVSGVENSTVVITKNDQSPSLEKLLTIVQDLAKRMDTQVQQEISDSIETIKSEYNQSRPRGSVIRTAINVLNGIKGTVEFSAAVLAIVQFMQTIIT